MLSCILANWRPKQHATSRQSDSTNGRLLLAPPVRNSSGYRYYEPGDLERVTFIKRNQELGFLEENRAADQIASAVAAMTFTETQ